jgi:DNA-binding NarL/FixJ family response regulator
MYKVLVIDDDDAIREEVTDILTFEGFEVIQAPRGLGGLTIARETLPDLIVCDINMPDIDGYEVLEQLRTESLTATIPFIFLSAKARESDIRIGMNLGADDYLTKPFDNDELLNAVQSRLDRNATQQYYRLRQFSHRLVSFQESERQVLATQLKGNLGSTLSDLKLTLTMMHRLPQDSQQTSLLSAESLLEHALKEIEGLAYSLHPSTLHSLGLLPTLLIFIDRYSATTNIAVQLEHQDLGLVLDREMLIAVYRIIQESLTNVAKHANTPQVQLRIWVEEDKLRLQVKDNGRGFDIEEALGNMSHVGIVGMQERANLLNGELSIISEITEGTQIIGQFPLNKLNSEPIGSGSKPVPRGTTLHLEEAKTSYLESSNNGIRVAIADTNEITRWSIYNLVDSTEEFAVVGQASDEKSLLALLNDLSVDLLVLSHTLQSEHPSTQLLDLVKQSAPSVRIVLLSHYIEYAYANEAIKRGAHGYLLKTGSAEEMLRALRNVNNGQQYIADSVMSTLKSAGKSKIDEAEINAFSTLTEREREIFYLVINGNTNRDIAEQLFISPRTAEAHRLNMMRKLGLRGTPALIRFAMDSGLMGK